MFEVTESPVILESLGFGFTNTERSLELEKLILAINVEGVGVSRQHPIDMCFGFVVVKLPNPSKYLEDYVKCKESYIEELIKVVTPYKEVL